MNTRKEIMATATQKGLVVTKARATVNGQTSYKVHGENGLFTKSGLQELVETF
jgi:hypothetical protein